MQKKAYPRRVFSLQQKKKKEGEGKEKKEESEKEKERDTDQIWARMCVKVCGVKVVVNNKKM